MMLNVRPAKGDEHAFAWPMYQSYISDHIFPKHESAAPKRAWLSDEEAKFQKTWQQQESYIIEIDGTSVGWLSISKLNNRLTIQNIFIDEAWQAKGIGDRIIREMIPTWKTEKRVVEIPVHMGGPLAAEIKSTLRNLGFSPTGDDGLVRLMTANWSR